MKPGQMRHVLFRSLAVGLAFGLSVAPVVAAQLRLEVRLIWGSNDNTYSKHKKVDEAIAAKLRNTFQWKYYYEINRVVGIVPSRGTNAFKMSEKCTLEVTELEGPRVGLTLIGDGKPVLRTTKNLTRGELTTIGEKEKNGCAWFIVMTELDEK
jgi:hypothetical protein